MAEEPELKKGKINDVGEVDTFEFFLFLVLLLVLMGSKHKFSPHFNLLDEGINKINSLLDMFSVTANGLKTLVTTTSKF